MKGSMEIQVGSIYYEWLTAFIKEPSPSLCILFWQNAWALLLSLACAIIVPTVVGFVSWLALNAALGVALWLLQLGALIDPMWDCINVFDNTYFAASPILGLVVWLFIITACLATAAQNTLPRLGDALGTQGTLFRNKMEARKSKFCPKVEYVNKSKSKD